MTLLLMVLCVFLVDAAVKFDWLPYLVHVGARLPTSYPERSSFALSDLVILFLCPHLPNDGGGRRNWTKILSSTVLFIVTLF